MSILQNNGGGAESKCSGGAWRAQVEKGVTLDLGVVNLGSTMDVEITLKKNLKKSFFLFLNYS